MKRFFPLLPLLLNGCFACGTGSRVEDVDPGLKVYRPAVPPLDDRHASARLDRVAPGTWMRYQMAKDGIETTVMMGAVRVDGQALWVEVVEEGDPKKASLRKISFDGEVVTARYQEIPASGPPSEVVDQPVAPASGAFLDTPASVKEQKQKLKVGFRTIDGTVFKKIFRDESLGREFEVEEAWSREVPPLLEDLEIEGAVGGLVSRKSRAVSIQLVDWGTGYTSVIP